MSAYVNLGLAYLASCGIITWYLPLDEQNSEVIHSASEAKIAKALDDAK